MQKTKLQGILLTLASGILVVFMLPRKEALNVSASASLLDEKSFQKLISELSEGAESLGDLKELAAKGASYQDFSAGKDKEPVTVELGELSWTAVYLTQNTKNETVLTLWLSEAQESIVWSQCDVRFSSYDSETPANLYGRSYIRAYLCGTPYLDASGEVTDEPAVQKESWKQFLDTYGEYLSTPEEIPYQLSQSAKEILEETNDLPNESLSEEQDLQYDYLEKEGYLDWKSDKLWLPSLSETGKEPGGGLWKVALSSRGTDETHSAWLRTGAFEEDHYDVALKSYYLHGDTGMSDTAEGETTLPVRPAVHLILDRVAPEPPQKQTAEKPLQTSANKTFDGTPLALTVQNADLFHTTNLTEGAEYTLSEDGKTGTFSATNAGEYRLLLSLNEDAVWSDGTSEDVELSLSIGQAHEVLRAAWTLNPKQDGQEPFLFQDTEAFSCSSVYNGRDIKESLGCLFVSLIDENGKEKELSPQIIAEGGGTLPDSQLNISLSFDNSDPNIIYDLLDETAHFTLTVIPRRISVSLKAGQTLQYGEPLPSPSQWLEYESDSLTLLKGDEAALTYSSVSSRFPAGIHEQSFTLAKEFSNRYILSAKSGSFTVLPKTVAAANVQVQSKEYDGTNSATLDLSGAQVTGALLHDDVILSASARFENKDAGREKRVLVTLTLAGRDAENYRLEQEEIVLAAAILPRKLRVRILDVSAVYGDPRPTFECVPISGETVSGDDLKLRLFLSENALNAGDYKISGECLNQNYEVEFIGGTYTIHKKKLPIPVLKDLVYNATIQEPNLDEALCFTGNKGGKDAGTYSVTVAPRDQSNYEFENGKTEIELEYRILPYSVSVRIDNAESTFGEKTAKLTYTVVGTVFQGDELGISLSFEGRNAGAYPIAGTWSNSNYAVEFIGGTYTIHKAKVKIPTLKNLIYNGTAQTPELDETLYTAKNAGGKNVGTYHTTLILKDAENYEFTNGESEIMLAYQILPRSLTVEINDATSIYGEAPATLTYTVLGEIFSEDELGITLTFHGKKAGKYEITGDWENENYDIEFINGTYSIQKAKLKVPTAADMVYNGQIQKPDLDEGKYNVVAEDKKDVGTYRATVTPKDAENYEFEGGKCQIVLEYRILPYEISVKIQDASSVYGEEYAKLTYTVIGTVCAEDELGIALSFQGTSAGEYEITGSWTNENYAVSFTNGTYRIEKAKVEIPVLEDLIYNGTPQQPKYDQTLCIAVGEFGKDAGVYSLTLSLKDGSNYEFTDGTTESKLKYQILPYQITIQIHDAQSAYGENFEELTFTVLGEVFAGDELGVALKFDGQDAGTYAITGTWENQNYHIEFSNGRYTIHRAHNEWLGEFPQFRSDEIPDLSLLPHGKFGEAEVSFFLDADCTQEFTGDLTAAPPGTYFMRVKIDSSQNFEGLEKVFSFEIQEKAEAQEKEENRTPPFNFNLLFCAFLIVCCLVIIYEMHRTKD